MICNTGKNFFDAAPTGRNDINHVYASFTATLCKIVGKPYGMLPFFIRLFVHPMCKTIPSFFLEVESHLEIQI